LIAQLGDPGEVDGQQGLQRFPLDLRERPAGFGVILDGLPI